MTKRNRHIGSSLDDSLKKEGILEQTRAIALKDAIAWQVHQAGFNQELGRRLDSLDKGRHVSPEQAKARLRKKSEQRRKAQGSRPMSSA